MVRSRGDNFVGSAAEYGSLARQFQDALPAPHAEALQLATGDAQTAAAPYIVPSASEKLLQGKRVSRALACDVAASFQFAAVRHVCERTRRALEWCAAHAPVRSLVLSGGVARNLELRSAVAQEAEAANVDFFVPDLGALRSAAQSVRAAHRLSACRQICAQTMA